MLEFLHWLPIHQRIEYRIGALVWRCQLGLTPTYLLDLCRPVSGAQGSRSLRSAGKGVLTVPFARTYTMQSRAFSVVGPVVWNGLPLELRLLPRSLSDTFYNRLKQFSLAVLESGAPLSSPLEEVLYKYPNE